MPEHLARSHCAEDLVREARKTVLEFTDAEWAQYALAAKETEVACYTSNAAANNGAMLCTLKTPGSETVSSVVKVDPITLRPKG